VHETLPASALHEPVMVHRGKKVSVPLHMVRSKSDMRSPWTSCWSVHGPIAVPSHTHTKRCSSGVRHPSCVLMSTGVLHAVSILVSQDSTVSLGEHSTSYVGADGSNG